MSVGADDRSLLTSEMRNDFGTVNRDRDETEMTEVETTQKRYEDWAMPLIAEFVGMLLFGFMHCMATQSLPIIGVAFNNGLFVTIMVITIGHISGAHVNAAVTLAVAVAGYFKWMMVPLYIVAQLIGSLCGAGLAKVALGYGSGAFALGQGVSIGQGVLTETMMTILVVFTVLQSAVDLESNNAAYAIGFAIMIDIVIGGKISGGCMNPSLSFGPAVVSGAWNNYWIYWVAPIMGALVASALHKLALATRKNRVTFRGSRDNYENISPNSRDSDR